MKASQLPRQPSMQREQMPLEGTTDFDRLTVLVASLPLGARRFIIPSPSIGFALEFKRTHHSKFLIIMQPHNDI
jgi:hypothetical protein